PLVILGVPVDVAHLNSLCSESTISPRKEKQIQLKVDACASYFIFHALDLTHTPKLLRVADIQEILRVRTESNRDDPVGQLRLNCHGQGEQKRRQRDTETWRVLAMV